MSAALDYSRSIGETLAASLVGLDTKDIPFLKGASEAAENSPDLGTHDIRKIASQFAALAYICADRRDRPEAMVFAKMASQTVWNRDTDVWLAPVLKVMGTVSEARQLQKQATQLGGLALGSIASKLGKAGLALAPGALSSLPMVAAGAGAGAGALWWLANKDAEADSDEVTKIKAKRNYYKALTDEISEELQRKGLVNQETGGGAPGSREKVVAAMRESSLY